MVKCVAKHAGLHWSSMMSARGQIAALFCAPQGCAGGSRAEWALEICCPAWQELLLLLLQEIPGLCFHIPRVLPQTWLIPVLQSPHPPAPLLYLCFFFSFFMLRLSSSGRGASPCLFLSINSEVSALSCSWDAKNEEQSHFLGNISAQGPGWLAT